MWEEAALATYAEGLATQPFDDVIAVIEGLAEGLLGDGEPAIPRYGEILMRVKERSHPLRLLHTVVRNMAVNYREKITQEMFDNFDMVCGHRTDADIQEAFENILRDSTVRSMPTAVRFRQAMPILTILRDGTRPQ